MYELRQRIKLLAFCFITFLLVGCDNSGANDDEVLVDLDVLFAAPTANEVAMVQGSWVGRDVSVQNVQVLAQDTVAIPGFPESIVQIVSHTVTGLTHIGAVLRPVNSQEASIPVLVYNHFGDEGVDIDATLGLIAIGLSGISTDFVLVVPAFRSETLTLDGVDYTAEGPESPWDFDVDDSIALLNVALDLVPEADESRIGTLGVSRGGGVSLLMAARDPRIQFVVEYFGPTDFFVQSGRETTEEALQGDVRPLPGLDFLTDSFLFPLQDGLITIEEVRLEYIRRSPVYFVEELPHVQVHHGNQDQIVPVDHAMSLERALAASSKAASEYEVYFYPTAGHDFLQMPESFGRAITLFNNEFSPGSM